MVRLFASEKEIERLRNRIDGAEHHRMAWSQLLNRVETGADAEAYVEGGYPRIAAAREAAFAYLVTEEDAYADAAFDALREAAAHHGDLTELKGLTTAALSVGLGLAWDWCREGWSASQREEVAETVRAVADFWPKYFHWNTATEHNGSNWVAVLRGGEWILRMAAPDLDFRVGEERWDFLEDQLLRHVETAYGPSGWTQEGNGYLEYTLGFLLPAALAARDVGRPALFEAVADHEFYRQVMHTHSFTADRRRVQTGVGGAITHDEGPASLLFPFVPEEDLGYYRYWYDRHMGHRAADPSFDRNRAGTVWALLFYPAGVDSRDPTPTGGRSGPSAPDGGFDPGVIDTEQGAYFFRNRFRDGNDVLVGSVSRNDYHGNAWHQHETTQLSVVAFDHTFAAGPGKDYDASAPSKLLVDGEKEPTVGEAKTLGSEVKEDGGGHVAFDASDNFELSRARRDLVVDVSGEAGVPAVIGTRDRLADDEAHEFAWQLRPGEGVEPTVLSDGFRLDAEGGVARGWVLSPTADGESGERARTTVAEGAVRVLASGDDVDLSVLLALFREEAPEATLDGDTLRLGDATYVPDDLTLDVQDEGALDAGGEGE